MAECASDQSGRMAGDGFENQDTTSEMPMAGRNIRQLELREDSGKSHGETAIQVICDASPPKAATRGQSKAWSRRSSWHSILPGERAYPRIAALVKSPGFEITIGTVILLNCATMGIEAELLLGNAQAWEVTIAVSEHAFTAIFVLELALRTTVYGWRSFVPGFGGTLWNCLDAALVLVTGVLAVWILPLFEGMDMVTLETLTVLRALRLVRLVRVVSRVDMFREVWLLLRGLAESMRVLFWTIVVIFFITYMFAIFGVVLIGVELKTEYESLPPGPSEPRRELEYLTASTGSVTAVMYTLLQVLTLDSWTSIARPIMKYVAWSWIYFYLYICIAVFVLMNLVTAIIVENALKNSQKDAEELLAEKDREREQAFHQFRHLFNLIDVDGNGELSKNELEAAFEDPEIEVQLRLLDIRREDCREIFDLIDTGDGVLSLQEFFDGLRRMEGSAQARDLFRVLKTTEQVARRLRDELGIERSPSASASPCGRRSSSSSSPRRVRSAASLKMTGSPLARLSPRPSTGNAKPHSLDDIARKLDEVVGALGACNRRVEECTQQVGALAGDLGDLRSSVEAQSGQGGLEHQRSLSVPRDEHVRDVKGAGALARPAKLEVGRVTRGIVT